MVDSAVEGEMAGKSGCCFCFTVPVGVAKWYLYFAAVFPSPPFNKRSSLLQNSTVHIFPIPSSSKIPSPHPSEVSELVVQAITAVCEVTWRPFLSRLVLCGALARLPGLCQRLQRELRAELPSEWPVELLMEEEPEWSVWQGEGLGWDGEGGDGVFRNLLDVFVCLEVWKGWALTCLRARFAWPDKKRDWYVENLT